MTTAAVLRREGASLVERLRLWTPARWAASAGGGTRADVAHHLAQDLADRAAALEGRAPRPLPRLDTDLVLADQLAVAVDDLVRAGPDDAQARAAAAHLLLHRTELLGDEVPPGLDGALGGDVLARGREECGLTPS